MDRKINILIACLLLWAGTMCGQQASSGGGGWHRNPYTLYDYVTPSLFPYRMNLVFFGDSETAGKADIGMTRPWPYWLTNLYLSPTNIVGVTNCAVVAHTSWQNTTNMVNAVLPWARNPATNTMGSILSIWSGINDIHYETNAGLTFLNLSNLWYAARSNGMEVVAFTIPPLNDYTFDYFDDFGNYSINTNRLALNELIRGQKGIQYDYLVDVEKILGEIGLEGALTINHTIEKIHFNSDASRRIAEEWASVYRAGKVQTNWPAISVTQMTIGSLTSSATNAPSSGAAPSAWMNANVNGTNFWIPLYK